MKLRLMSYAYILFFLSCLLGCGNYEEFKEEFQSGLDSIAPGQELSFQVIKSQVLTARCTSCHSKYATYENVKNNISAIAGMVRANVMPKDGPLTDQQKSLLFAWIDAGMPENPINSQPGPNPTPNPNPIPPQERLTFENLSQKVFRPYCIQCHSSFNDYTTVKSNINIIVNLVRTDVMPKGGILAIELKSLLFDWAAAGAPQDATGPIPIPIPIPNPTPSPIPLPLEANYQSLNQHVFAKKCIACHNPAGRASFLDLSTYESMKRNSSRLFDFRRPERSDIIEEILDDEEPMPPRGSSYDPVTNLEIQTLIKWIRLGVPKN